MERESNFDEEAAAEPELLKTPRLRVLHILLWTTFCAVLLALARPSLQNTSDEFS